MATRLVEGTEALGAAYIAAMDATTAMLSRQIHSTLNMVELHQAAETNSHQLLTAYEARLQADKWQHRAWIQRRAYQRLALLARRRLGQLNDFAVSTAKAITEELRTLEGMHVTATDPFE